MKNLNPAKEAAFNHLVQFLDEHGYLMWFNQNFQEAKDFDKKGFWIMHNGSLRLMVDEPQNVTVFENSKFKLVGERQEKFYTYFFSFEESDV
jgi:hypothetical protein